MASGSSATEGRPTSVREITVAAEEGQLSRVRDFIVEVCEEAGFSSREVSNTKLAVDEACTNIIKHAYSDRDENGDIKVQVSISPGDISIVLRDRGSRFDFAGVKDPDLDHYVETGRKGGLGVFLINRLMDGVEYHSSDGGNELVLTKRSQATISASLLPQMQPLRGTLRFKFTMRAATGLFILMAALWTIVFARQSNDIASQETSRWIEKRRLAENLAARSIDVLLEPDEFSPKLTNLSAELAKLVIANDDLAYVRVTDASGQIWSSGNIEEMFTPYDAPPGRMLLRESDAVVWREAEIDGEKVRDIEIAVTVPNAATGERSTLGRVHIGVVESALETTIDDPRLSTTLLLFVAFAAGLLLIVGLVRVFVRPIQALTDGVRAIGDGTLAGKLDVRGPAEIGAIAAVFNEITDKFKKAQDSILEQEKLQKEMEVAKQIQHSLLPRNKPNVSGYDIAPLYQAAAEVGGDYYDFVQVDDDTIGVVVADVSGKGVPGSLVMTMIRTALRMEARGNKNASDVMAKMNAFVTDDMKKGMFVTMFYVILDSQNRIISYASAGHNPMILYRHETHETFFLNPKGFPVGISLPDEELFRRSISLEKIKLKKDDMLLIYTDGVTEAMNDRREQYGEERLLSVIREYGDLSPDDFIARLEADIKKFTAGYPQNDDITVVAVKEKLTADDVLFGIRKKLIDLVDLQGLSVKEACKQMRVSPATYYRYKKRLEVMGERGLKNKVLRADVTLKRVSIEARKRVIDIIAANPDWGAKRITDEFNKDRAPVGQITERMVYEELRRLNLNTRELRVDYLRRHRLVEGEHDESTVGGMKPSGEVVDDFLREISDVEPETTPEDPVYESADTEDTSEANTEPLLDFSDEGGLGVNLSEVDGVTEIRVNGHLDSVTSALLEKKLHEVVEAGRHKLLVDLSDVNYISSGGWGIFTGEVSSLRRRGGDIVLVGMSSEVFDVYELLGFADVLRAFPDVADAHEYFTLPPEERISAPSTLPKPTVLDDPVHEDVPGESYVPEWESLRIEATTVGADSDMAVISLMGIIDTVSAENLRGALARVISKGILKIVVDMSQVEYVSSGGWGTFTERLRELRRGGGDIKLFGMDPDVYYVFTMLGFNIVLSSFDILSDAIEDFEHETGDTPGTALETPDEVVSAPTIDIATPDDTAPEQAPLSPDDARTVVSWDLPAAGNFEVARLHGLIEATAIEHLSDSLDHRLSLQPRAIIFDLHDVSYISSAGWGQFARCYDACKGWGGNVILFGLNAELHEIYSFLEFNAFVRVVETEADAIAALEQDTAETQAESDTTPYASAPEGRDEAATPSDALTAEDLSDVDEILGRDVVADVDASDDVSQHDDATRQDDRPQIAGNDWPQLPPPDEPAPVNREESQWTTKRPLDVPPSADKLDVDGAVADKNIHQDDKLRRMGWAKYGEKLKQKRSRKKNGDHD